MDMPTFWQLIDQSNQAASLTGRLDEDDMVDALAEQLTSLPLGDVRDFEKRLSECMALANHWDLWAAAYIINGGCSDDGFIDFRAWLVAQGQTVFKQTLSQPDSLAEYLDDDAQDVGFESLAYVADEVHEERTGQPIDEDDEDDDGPSPFGEPEGEPFEENDDDLAKRLPKLWAKFGNA